jgi:phosphotransferase system  glucose/maltose/N-acetylglucosamine-specific IIC component
MTIIQRFAVAQIAVTCLGAIYQAASGVEDLMDTTVGSAIGYTFGLLTFITLIGALLKAWENQQYKWFWAMALIWPVMYFFIFKYARLSRQ